MHQASLLPTTIPFEEHLQLRPSYLVGIEDTQCQDLNGSTQGQVQVPQRGSTTPQCRTSPRRAPSKVRSTILEQAHGYSTFMERYPSMGKAVRQSKVNTLRVWTTDTEIRKWTWLPVMGLYASLVQGGVRVQDRDSQLHGSCSTALDDRGYEIRQCCSWSNLRTSRPRS